MKLDLGRRSFRQPDGSLPLRPLHTRLLALLLLPLLLTGSIPVVAQPMANPAPAAPADAQPSAMAGRTIESIEFRGLQALSEETLLYYLGLEPGQTLDEVKLNNNLQELWGRSLVDDIEVEATPSGSAGAGVKLVITVQERP